MARPSKRYTRDLEDFVAFANLLPPDWQPKEPAEAADGDDAVCRQLFAKFKKQFLHDRRAFYDDVFLAANRTSPEVLLGYGPKAATWHEHHRRFLYELFYAVRQTLSKLIARGEVLPQPGDELAVNTGAFSRALSLNSEGQIGIYLDPFYDIFIQQCLNGQDVKRLKICPVCHKFFWARRKDKGACSPPCLLINRVRKYRASNPRESKAL